MISILFVDNVRSNTTRIFITTRIFCKIYEKNETPMAPKSLHTLLLQSETEKNERIQRVGEQLLFFNMKLTHIYLDVSGATMVTRLIHNDFTIF